ncbi:MAG TPA: hypothetical protein VFH02_04450 [Jiangellaceae bacterium]|nr:hypothetical protein [Jiangellaceae bacterium]
MNKDARRLPGTAVAVAGWLAVALVATGVTLAAVTLIGSGIFGDSTRTRSQAEVAQALAALTPAGETASSAEPTGSPGTPSPSQRASETPGALRRLITSSGGNVLAECAGREVVVISWTPAQGYRVDDVDLEARSDVDVRFEGEETDVKVKIRCADDRPVAEIDEDG